MDTPAAAAPSSPRVFDPGLDLVRAGALVLMVAAHFIQDSGPLRSPGALFGVLDLVGEAAPAFFFFAFGMTSDSFLRKRPEVQAERGLLLLCVALSHNVLVQHSLVSGDFLFLLWAWQALLAVAERESGRLDRVYPWLIGAVLVLLVTVGPAAVGGFCRSVLPGEFPLLPWGLFVLLGLLFGRAGEAQPRWGRAGGLAIGGALLLCLTGRVTAQPALAVTKRPLSGPYVLLFGGLAPLVIAWGRRWPGLVAGRNPCAWAAQLLSRNLLLATVLHYLPEQALACLARTVIPPGLPEAAVLGAAVGGTVLCMVLLLGLMRAALALWERVKAGAPCGWARQRRQTVSLALVFVVAGLRALAGTVPGAATGLGGLVEVAAIVVMAYLALELAEGRRAAATA